MPESDSTFRYAYSLSEDGLFWEFRGINQIQTPSNQPDSELVSDTKCQYCKSELTPNRKICWKCSDVIKDHSANVLNHTPTNLADGLLFGSELEVKLKDAYQDSKLTKSAALLLDEVDPNFGILKYDGSVTRGFEIVSTPVTLSEVQKQWKPVFDLFKSRKIGTFTHYPGYLGMHTHVSKAALGKEKCYDLFRFFNTGKNAKFIEMIGGRRLNRYCKPYATNYITKENTESAVAYASRYVPLNLKKPKTAEFRFFRSTTKFEVFNSNIEFIQSFVDYLHTDLTVNHLMCYSNYIEWLFSSPSRFKIKYPHLFDVKGKEMLKFVNAT